MVLVGWSSGALAAYAYFEQFGYQNARAFVSIDMSPKPLMDRESGLGYRYAGKRQNNAGQRHRARIIRSW